MSAWTTIRVDLALPTPLHAGMYFVTSKRASPYIIYRALLISCRCLDSLSKPICPLCRTRFQTQDIRKLHIDRGQTPRIPLLAHAEPPSTSDEIIEFSHEARRFQTGITRIVKEGAPASELRGMIDKCHIWLKSQPPDQVTTICNLFPCSRELILGSILIARRFTR